MFNFKKTHLLCFLLVLVMVLPLALTACGGDGGKGSMTTASTTAGATNGGGGTQGTQEEEEIVDPEVEDWVEIYDMGIDGGARQINFLTHATYNTNYYFFRHEEDSDVLAGDALAQSSSTRTLYLEEQFNVAFKATELGSSPMYSALQSSLMGNGGQYDLIYPHPTNYMINFLSEGLFQNLYNFDAIDLTKPWWNQSQVYEFSVDDKLYLAVNDMSICGQSLGGLVFNRELYNQLQLTDDLYSLVYDGEWTMAKLGEVAMKFGDGAGENGILDVNDKFGLAVEVNPFWQCGGRVISKDEKGDFYLSIDADLADKIAGAYYKLVWESEEHVWAIDEKTNYAAFPNSKKLASFKGGNYLFFTYDLGGLYSSLWDITFDLGYLPWPKLDTEQDDYYYATSTGYFAIPQKVTDNKVASTLLEALAIHSFTNYRKDFFETILLSKMSDKPEDYKMLTFIHETKIYDWGHALFIADGSNTFIEDMVITEHSSSVSTFIRGHKKSWEKILLNIDQIRNGKFGG